MSTNNVSPKLDVYQIVTDRIIALLEKGTIPWQKPWRDSGMPMNLITKRPYRGINFWLLLSLDYAQNLFLTWDQLKKIGGSVKQGEHGHPVIFWKTRVAKEVPEGEEQRKQVPLLRYYKVFNVAQCRDIPESVLSQLQEIDTIPIGDCETIIKNMPQAPQIVHKANQAFYDITKDLVNMPRKKVFKSHELYYTTLFHELIHSTGHERRLDRKTITEMAEFGSEPYSIEELVAEMGSAYLSSYAGISNKLLVNNAAYIQGWLGALKNDKRFVILAGGQAQKAVDFIMNVMDDSPDVKVEV